MLLKDFLNEGASRLETLYPTKEARNIMLMLCESRIGTKSYTHIVEPEYQIKDKALMGLMRIWSVWPLVSRFSTSWDTLISVG